MNEDFEQTIDLNREFAQSMAIDVGHHPFASMQEDPDKVKARHIIAHANSKEARRAEQRKRYYIYMF